MAPAQLLSRLRLRWGHPQFSPCAGICGFRLSSFPPFPPASFTLYSFHLLQFSAIRNFPPATAFAIYRFLQFLPSTIFFRGPRYPPFVLSALPHSEVFLSFQSPTEQPLTSECVTGPPPAVSYFCARTWFSP